MEHQLIRFRPLLLVTALLGVGIAAVIIVGGLAGSDGSATARTAPLGPRLRLNKTAEKFGVVRPGAMLSTNFVLHNDGDAPLIVSNLDTSCGCTPAEITRNTIPPGETAEISVDSRIPSHPGMVSHAIFFETNDPTHKKISLPLSARAAWPISADPIKVHLPSIPVGTESVHSLELFASRPAASGSNLKVKQVEISVPWIDLVLKESDSRRLRYEVQVTPPRLGRITEWISFRTGNKDRPTIMVPIEGDAVGPISRRPPVLVLGNMAPGSRKNVSLTVESERRRVELASAEVADGHWTLQQPTLDRLGSEQDPVITLPIKVPAKPGFHQTMLIVSFAECEQPIRVPISVYITDTQPKR